jgi:predicted KAP-like P-loop ATPase
VSEDDDGKPLLLKEWEDKAVAGESLDLSKPWGDSFVQEWLRLPPRLADQDLRGVLYVSREHAPLITPQDRLSSDGADLLGALLEHPDMASDLQDRLSKLSRVEITVIMDRLLEKARQEQEWGVPPILEACLVVSKTDPPQGARLSAFLIDRPAAQIRANIVPKIAEEPWAKRVFDAWDKLAGILTPVKNAIKERSRSGNVGI